MRLYTEGYHNPGHSTHPADTKCMCCVYHALIEPVAATSKKLLATNVVYVCVLHVCVHAPSAQEDVVN